MEPASVNHFETVSDDLLENILTRSLWNPCNVTARKGQERVWLGGVCKRFRRLVYATKSLDWDFRNGQTEGELLRYLHTYGDRECPFTRVCLRWDADHGGLMTGILLLLLHAAATVEEFRLFVSIRWDLRWCADWESIFMLLQRCKKLRLIDISLYTVPPESSAVTLAFARPLNQFPALRSLTLYGFGISGALIAPFLESFPVLEDLEMHCEPGALSDFETLPLNKLYVWGDESVGFDRSKPESALVPRSMDMLFGLLKDPCADSHLIAKLQYLMRSEDNQKIILTRLGYLPGLMRLLKTGGYGQKEFAVELLTTVLPEEEVIQHFCRAPDNLEIFVLGQASGARAVTKFQVTNFLWKFISDSNERREKLVNVPGVVSYILGVARDGVARDGEGDRPLELLINLMANAHLGKLIADEQGVLKDLVGMLYSEEWIVRAGAATALRTLAALDKDLHSCVAAVPQVFEALAVSLCDKEVEVRGQARETLEELLKGTHSLKAGVVNIGYCVNKLMYAVYYNDCAHATLSMMHRLSMEDSFSKAVAAVPGCVRALVQFLDRGSGQCRHEAARALYHLTRNNETLEKLTGIAGVVPKLVAILSDRADNEAELKEAAVLVLGRLAVKVEGRREMVNSYECLRAFENLLRSSSKSLRWAVAGVLDQLAVDTNRRSWLQGSIHGLLGLLADQTGDLDSAVAVAGEVAAARCLELLVRDAATRSRAWPLFTRSSNHTKWLVEHRLVKILGAASLSSFQADYSAGRAALLTLAAMPLEEGAGQPVLDSPGVLQTLVGVANAEEVPKELQEAAGEILRSLGRKVHPGDVLPGAVRDELPGEGEGTSNGTGSDALGPAGSISEGGAANGATVGVSRGTDCEETEGAALLSGEAGESGGGG